LPNPTPETSTAETQWDHPQFTGYDSEIAAIEGFYSEGAGINIPWLLSLSVSQGNAMTQAIARQGQFFEDSDEGAGEGGGNQSGAQTFGGAQSGGLSVQW